MAIVTGADTVNLGGSRFTVPTRAAYNPYGFGQLVQPQPIQNINFPPMLPAGGGAVAGGSENVGGYGTAGQNITAAQAAGQMPFGLRESPLWWALIAAVIGVLGLTVIHWRKTVVGGSEALHLGGAEEHAEAGA